MTTHPAAPVGTVVTRFCPSPTGLVHVGSMRTALFSWAYARHTGGRVVFPIGGTDAGRGRMIRQSLRQMVGALTPGR